MFIGVFLYYFVFSFFIEGRHLNTFLPSNYNSWFHLTLSLQELVQNAENAGANCIKIMYDDTENQPKSTSSLCQYCLVCTFLLSILGKQL